MTLRKIAALMPAVALALAFAFAQTPAFAGQQAMTTGADHAPVEDGGLYTLGD